MSGNAKLKGISVGDLREELRRKLDRLSANGRRPSRGSGVPATGGEGASGCECGSVDHHYGLRRFTDDVYKREFEVWIKVLRQPGVFYGEGCNLVRLLEPRAYGLVRSCDALDSGVCARLAQIFCTRWAFTDSEAREIFGEYYHPLLATKWLESVPLSAEVARRDLLLPVSVSDCAGDGTVTVVYPEPVLIDLAAWHSTTLSFIAAFGAQRTQIESERASARGDTPEYPPLWITVHTLLSEPTSPLHRALRAPAPPKAEVELLGKYLLPLSRPDTGGRHLSFRGRRAPDVMRAELAAALPTATKDGSVSLVLDHQSHQGKLVCSPTILRAMLDAIPDIYPEGPYAPQLPLAQSIVMPLGDHERAEVVAVLYGASTRGDIELKTNGEFARTPLGKVASTLWPGIAPLSTRWLLDLVFIHVFDRYRGLTAPLSKKVCEVKDLVRDKVATTRFLGNLPYAGELIRVFHSLPDREWIQLSDFVTRFNVSRSARFGVIDGLSEQYPIWSRECILGWWCGFLDLAFAVDKKGRKTEVVAFRVNRSALRSVVIPEVAARATEVVRTPPESGERSQSESGYRFGSEYSCSVEVLPNGEILCPPNLHPAIRFCLATVCTYKRSNTFALPERSALSNLPLALSSGDLYRFISSLSRHPLPGTIREALESRQVEVPRIGLFTPSFVLTTIDRSRIKALLDDLNPGRYFAAEIAPEVWGIYDRYERSPLDGLSDFESTSRTSPNPTIGKVVKIVSKRGDRAICNLHGLALVGAVPSEGGGQNESFDTEVPSPYGKVLPEPLKTFHSFFDLTPDESSLWEDKASVLIFSTIPSEVQATHLFETALAPCLKVASTRVQHL